VKVQTLTSRSEIQTLSLIYRFSRGWTLQELIAPRNVVFYTKDWINFASKRTISKKLCDITGISIEVLWSGNLSTASIAQRMCWASKRQTTRREDLAYCLMGIFNVNMPLLYGEGAKAFIRLQEAIVSQSDDQSIFAWTDKGGSDSSYRGPFARSPFEFADCRKTHNFQLEGTPYSLTNMGLQITLPLQPVENQEGLYVARLNCVDHSTEFVGIYVRGLSGSGNQFARVCTDKLAQSVKWTGAAKPRAMFIRQGIRIPPSYIAPKIEGFLVQVNNLHSQFSNLDISTRSKYGQWDREKYILRPPQKSDAMAGAVAVRLLPSTASQKNPLTYFYVALGYDVKSNKGTWIVSNTDMVVEKNLKEILKGGEMFDGTHRRYAREFGHGVTKVALSSLGYRLSGDRLLYKIMVEVGYDVHAEPQSWNGN
jgi:hypothetical protein